MIDYKAVKVGDKLRIVGAGAYGFANLGDVVTVESCNGSNRCDVVHDRSGEKAYFALTCGAARLEAVVSAPEPVAAESFGLQPEMQPVVDELRRRMKAGHGLERDVPALSPDPAPAKEMNVKLTADEQDARIKALGLHKVSKDTLMLMVVDLEHALSPSSAPSALREAANPPAKTPKCRTCQDSGFVAYWDGSAYAGEGCPDCPDAPAAALASPRETEPAARQMIDHWFTQGGHAEFGEIAGENADELIASILTVVRAARLSGSSEERGENKKTKS